MPIQIDRQVIVTVKPLTTPRRASKYAVRMELYTAGMVDYEINEEIIEIVS